MAAFNLKLRINDNRCTFSSGDEVKGYCDVFVQELLPGQEPTPRTGGCFWWRGGSDTSNKPIQVSLHLYGLGHVHWKETQSRPVTVSGTNSTPKQSSPHQRQGASSSTTVQPQGAPALANYEVSFEDSRTYLDLEQKLLLPRNAQLAANNNVISLPFSFRLPQEVVPSFEHNHGNVHYWIEATIIEKNLLPSGGRALKEIANIDVAQVFDWRNPRYNVPVVQSEMRKIGWICCSAGPFFVQAELDRCGFHCDEPVVLSARFENHDLRREAMIHVKLKQRITFRAEGKTKTVSNRWNLIRLPNAGLNTTHQHRSCILAAGETTNWTRQQFLLPRVNQPSIGNASIFEVDYSLQVGVSVNWSGELSVSLPVTLGTARNSDYSSAVAVTQQMLPSLANLPPLDPPPSYASIYGGEAPLIVNTNRNHRSHTPQIVTGSSSSSSSQDSPTQTPSRRSGWWRSWFRRPSKSTPNYTPKYS